MGVSLNKADAVALHLRLNGTPHGTHATDAINGLACQNIPHILNVVIASLHRGLTG
jgi:hypothetical protein